MSYRRFSSLLAGVAVAALALGSVSTASAATSARLDRSADAQTARPPVQSVHWEYSHHHRYWVPDHRRHY